MKFTELNPFGVHVARRSAAAVSCLRLLGAFARLRAQGRDLAGWGRARWGMRSGEIAALYPAAIRLAGPIQFHDSYADLAPRHAAFAGLDFTVSFQMSTRTRRLVQVLLERNRPGRPLEGRPLEAERVWLMPATSVHATFLDFGPYVATAVWRRLLVRYAPCVPRTAACRG